ncbi:MAG: glycosyltransferase family 4 protein [Actinomycetota bacterium]
MKIGMIAPPWVAVPPPAYGGTEMVIDTLARGLHGAGVDVVLFASRDSTCPVPRRTGPQPAVGFGVGAGVDELRHVIAAYEALRDCDVLHDHTLAGPLYRHRPPEVPVVTTNHGPFGDELTPIYRAMANDAAIVAISHHQAAVANARRVPVAAVIHHGIDPNRFPVGGGTGGYLAFLGRMTPDKGVHRAIQVARAAGMPLRIAAKCREPHEQSYFDAQVRPLLGGGIEYVGEIGHIEKVALLCDAVALVNPIRWPEPFGLVMIEALACGTPVVAFPEGAAPEIVDHCRTGFLCANEQAMVAAVRRVGDLDRRACRAAVEARFSAAAMVDAHLRLYRRVLEGDTATAASKARLALETTQNGNGRGNGVRPLATAGVPGAQERDQEAS